MNNIWVGTGSGLCCINPQTENIDRYTTADGLLINQFNYSSACKKPDGELYFGTINGMISFYPEQVRSVNPHFNIALTAIWSNSEYMSPNNEKASIPSSISELTEITLTHDQAQSLRLEYSGLNYQYTYNTQYAMKMEGIDKDWQFVGNQHQVPFRKVYFKDQSQQRRYSLGRNGTKGPCHQNPPTLVAITGSVFCICIALLINHLRRLPIYQNAYYPAHATENGT